MIQKYKCERCGNEFKDEDWRKRRFCSKKCSAQRPNDGQYKNGYKHDEKTEAKRIKSIRENPSYGMLGKKHTEETKKRMSESSKLPYNYIDGGYRGKIKTDKCEECGEFNKRTIVHHKDGDRKNNQISNLKALCDSCHRLLHLKIQGKVNKIDWKNKDEVKKYHKRYHKHRR